MESATLTLRDRRPGADVFRSELLAGLGHRPKRISCKFFYDKTGSQLFDQICELPEYYPTRTENLILQDRAHDIARLIGPRCLLVELGSGSSLKTRILLDHLEAPAGYVPIDIARRHLLQSARRLSELYPALEIMPVCADYTQPLELPRPRLAAQRTILFFPGSTIGNFQPREAEHFLRSLRHLAGAEGALLMGVDLQKDRRILEAAYNDAQGVTARFNQNVLVRANHELDAAFDLDLFQHHAFYNQAENRIEMHLISLEDQSVRIGEVTLSFEAGEHIITEYSYKYNLAGFGKLARQAGWQVSHVWTDQRRLFSVQFLTPAAIR